MKPIKILNSIDDTVMSVVNGINHAWNWTTGYTKKELADLCFIAYGALGTAVIFSDPSIIQNKNILDEASILAIAPLASFYALRKNKELHEREINKKWNTVDFNAEEIRNEGRAIGYISLISTITSSFFTSKYPQIHDSGLIALTSLSLGGFLTSSDNLPPRKNCISRGLDYLVQRHIPSRVVA